MAPKRERRVIPIGPDRYRVVTTITVERIVTAAELEKLGIPVPQPDVPWQEKPAPAPVLQWRAQVSSSKPGMPSPFAQVMTFWKQRLGSFDARLPKHLPAWLDAFGAAALMGAISAVADDRRPGSTYLQFVQELRKLNSEAADPGS